MIVFFLSLAFAQKNIEYYPTTLLTTSSHINMHGPDKPPPSDGYEFKGKKGGNAKSKIGFLFKLKTSSSL